MDNRRHLKHYPYTTSSQSPVNRYLFGREENDVAFPIFNTGLSQPIYDLNGNVKKALPLEMWPPYNDYSKDVYLMNKLQPPYSSPGCYNNQTNTYYKCPAGKVCLNGGHCG
jgi:hypothetical protein